MRRCLSENILLRLVAGGGSAIQRTHLKECPSCTKRYEHLTQHLAAVEHILQEPPPATRYGTVSSPRFVYRYKIPLAVAATVLLVLGWGWLSLQKQERVTVTRTLNTEVLSVFEREIVPALFATTSVSESLPPVPVSDTTYVEAALSGGWPCEVSAVSRTPACEIYPFPLLITEQ